jgi:hypothetical protein
MASSPARLGFGEVLVYDLGKGLFPIHGIASCCRCSVSRPSYWSSQAQRVADGPDDLLAIHDVRVIFEIILDDRRQELGASPAR